MPFKSVSPNVDEDAFKRKISNPRRLTRTLARLKAESVTTKKAPDDVVIGSDQVLVFAGKIFGKPGTRVKAEEQLRRFSGKSVQLLTAVCVIGPKKQRVEWIDVTRLKFRKLSREEIKTYVEKDAPIFCAGSFKFESLGIALFDTIATSDPTAIEGLPLLRLNQTLKSLFT